MAFLEATETTTVKKISNQNMDKDMKRGFTEKDTQMRNNHMKRCSLSLAIT